jgi:type VI secretion system protein ImpC
MGESLQSELGLPANRPPRVHITYDVETGGAMEKKELPFIVGVMSCLSGAPDDVTPLKERKFVEIDRDNFNDIFKGYNVHCSFEIPEDTSVVAEKSSGDEKKTKKKPETSESAESNSPVKEKTTSLTLAFSKMDDLEPLQIISQIPSMFAQYSVRSCLRDMRGKLDGNDALEKIVTELLDSKDKRTDFIKAFAEGSDATSNESVKNMLEKGKMALDDSQRPYAIELIRHFTGSILSSLPEDNRKGATALLTEKINQIDIAISGQLDKIMHHEEFKKIEATWRGLHYLVFKTRTCTSLKIKVLNVSKDELQKDMRKAADFDQSALFKMIYEAEYGTYGGNPFSLLVGDYDFGRHPDDVFLLDKISGVAATAHAPFISAAHSKLFDLDNYFELQKPRDLSKIFESDELIKWRSFRESEDSRYVSLVLPKVLLRLPYGPDTVIANGINYVESVDTAGAKDFLWGNAAYMLAERITNAFSLYGWTAAIRGVESGGLVEDLPVYTFKNNDGDIVMTCPTQTAITDRREKELNDLGFISLCHKKGSDKAVFFGGQTTNLPKKYFSNDANANARISSMLPYILAASRFAHYIKAIMREKVGKFLIRDNVETLLNGWIANYILLDDSAANSVKARYPLREGKVVVTDVPGQPGVYKAVAFLKPHFQLEELTVSIRLVANLPA